MASNSRLSCALARVAKPPFKMAIPRPRRYPGTHNRVKQRAIIACQHVLNKDEQHAESAAKSSNGHLPLAT
jgi:hypothetical protein